MPTGKKGLGALPSVQRGARLVLDALRRARRDTVLPQDDPAAANLVRRVEHGRVHLAEHLTALLYDAFRRGAPREDVERPLRVALGIVAAWYETAPASPTALRALIQRETRRQAEADVAEIDLAADGSQIAIHRAIEQIDGHLVALEDLSMALHQRAVEAAA